MPVFKYNQKYMPVYDYKFSITVCIEIKKTIHKYSIEKQCQIY